MGGVNTSPENIAALELVVSGLPCRSSSIYPLEKNIEVRKLKFCKVSWYTDIFNLLHKNSELLDHPSWSLLHNTSLCYINCHYAATICQEIRKRQSEVLVDYCYTNCPTSAPIRNVTDKYGNLIDQVEGEGSYSVHEPKPPLPPTVHRETHYVQPGTAINFTCPR